MRIQIEYAAQLRLASGTDRETIELSTEATIRDLFHTLAEIHGDGLRKMILNEQGDPHRWLVIDRGGSLVRNPAERLSDDDHLRLLSPISGG